MSRIDPFSPIETRRIADEALLRAKSGGGGGGGITQLIGDVLAGPGSGAVTATVARINGATVPAAGALTTGNVLQVTGASALGYGPINLALSAAVTGLLAVANIAPAGTNGFVLTTTGGFTVWAAAAGGITQLTGDVTAGPGSGSQAATVARINGATVPAAGALTVGNGLYVTGASALGYSALNLAGGAGFVTGNLPVSNIAPSGTNGFVLTTTGGFTVWAAAAGGITQLTGDATAGPGSGSQAATVVAIHGASVPIAGALTTGNVLQVTGASALSYAPVNLAGGANFVTGALPVSNIAPAGTNGFVLTTTGGATVWAAGGSGIDQLTGDVLAGPGTGAQAATVVSAQSGGYAFQANGDILWQQSYASPGLSQTPSSASTGANFTIAPQGGTATGGNLIVELMTPVGSGTPALFQVEATGGNFVLQAGSYPGALSTGVLWLGDVSAAVGLHAIYGNGATTEVNATTELAFAAGGAIQGAFYGNGFQLFGAGSADFGGGVGVVGLAPATTIPTALPVSGGVGLFAYTGIGLQALGVNAQAILFPNFITSPIIAQVTTSGNTGTNLTLQPQNGALTGGNLIVNLQAPAGGGTEAFFEVQRGGSGIVWIGAWPTAPSDGAIWLSVTPSTTNMALFSDGSGDTFVNAGPGLEGLLTIGTGTVAVWNTSGFWLGGPLAAGSGSGNILGIENVVTAPTAVVTGVALYSHSVFGLQALGVDAQAITFPSFVTTPVIAQETVAATNGQPFGISAQGVSSGTGNGGVLSLAGGSPSGGGINGAVQLMTQGLAGIVLLAVGNYGLTLGQESLAVASTGTTTLTAAQYQWPEQNVSAVALTGAITIVLPNKQGLWIFDFSAVTGISGVNTITFQSGSATSSPISSFATLGIGSMVFVKTTGANGINVK